MGKCRPHTLWPRPLFQITHTHADRQPPSSPQQTFLFSPVREPLVGPLCPPPLLPLAYPPSVLLSTSSPVWLLLSMPPCSLMVGGPETGLCSPPNRQSLMGKKGRGNKVLARARDPAPLSFHCGDFQRATPGTRRKIQEISQCFVKSLTSAFQHTRANVGRAEWKQEEGMEKIWIVLFERQKAESFTIV